MDNIKEKELSDFLTTKGEYSSLGDVSRIDYDSISTNSNICKSLDLFCPNCKSNKTFIRITHSSNSWLGTYTLHPTITGSRSCNRLTNILYECPTCGKRLLYSLLFTNDSIIKISQYPSLYDVSKDELKKFKKNDLIDEESFNQIYKADICASSGYFVASYAYMRRVYETLMLSVFTQNKDDMDISEEEFKKLGGHEKIKKIRSYLAIDDGIYGPLYSLLSGGVHTYTEDECSTNYAFLKMVLLDVLAEQKAKKEREANRQAILKLHSQMKAEGK